MRLQLALTRHSSLLKLPLTPHSLGTSQERKDLVHFTLRTCSALSAKVGQLNSCSCVSVAGGVSNPAEDCIQILLTMAYYSISIIGACLDMSL